MTPEQQSALEGLAGRALAAEELAEIEVLLPSRNDVAIAAVISKNRKKFKHMPIGHGTIIECLGANGGAFIDALVQIGAQDRNVYWGMHLLNRGEFDLGKDAAQFQLSQLAAAMPTFAAGIANLKAMGYEADPVQFHQVSDVLNIAEGR